MILRRTHLRHALRRTMGAGLLALLLLFGACTGDDDDDTSPGDDDVTADDDDATGDDDDAAASMFAGTYLVGFQRAGAQFALGKFVIDEAAACTGDVASSDDFTVEVTCHVDDDGTVVVDSLTNSAGLDIEIDRATVYAEGTLDGTYRVGEEEGAFAGSRDNARVGEPSTEFDGSYELTILRGGDEETASAVFLISGGLIDISITDIEGYQFEIDGYVTSDGTVALSSIHSPEIPEVIAEASIDQETFEIHGLYKIVDTVGTITGRRSD